jgi:hypothetical protein
MTALTLRLQKYLENETTTVGAVATLRRVADETGAALRGGLRLNVIIPANDAGAGKLVDVEPGRWLVEATLPSGEILSEEVAVPEGQKVPVTLRAAEHSPHEWLGWQHLIGNIEGDETLKQIGQRARELAFSLAVKALPPELDPALASKIAGKIADLFGEVFTVVPATDESTSRPVLADQSKSSKLDTILTVNPGEPAVGLSEGPSAIRGARAWREILDLSHDSSEVCVSVEESREEFLYLYRFLGPAQHEHRVFAHVAWGAERFAVSLPVPWMHTVHHVPVQVEMLVRLHPLEKAVHIGVAVPDSHFGTLAGLMTASTLPQAKIVVEQAYRLLFDKRSNPLAAVAGGYVLLATGGSEEHSEWHRWIENLYRWFPDLPDGAILQASLLLLYPNDERSYEKALVTLFEAFDRGIPYFSVGIARLLDGLTLFAADSPEAKEKMILVQRVAQRLDLSQAFTVIRLSDKAKRA